MKLSGWRQWTILAIFAVVVTVTGLFTVRTIRRTIYWRRHHNEQIRPWMSVPYVAHAHRLPPKVLYDALGIPPVPHDRRPLKQIAREKNVAVEELIATLERTIAEANQPTLPPAPSFPSPGRSP
jgi:hypothetical protein